MIPAKENDQLYVFLYKSNLLQSFPLFFYDSIGKGMFFLYFCKEK